MVERGGIDFAAIARSHENAVSRRTGDLPEMRVVLGPVGVPVEHLAPVVHGEVIFPGNVGGRKPDPPKRMPFDGEGPGDRVVNAWISGPLIFHSFARDPSADIAPIGRVRHAHFRCRFPQPADTPIDADGGLFRRDPVRNDGGQIWREGVVRIVRGVVEVDLRDQGAEHPNLASIHQHLDDLVRIGFSRNEVEGSA